MLFQVDWRIIGIAHSCKRWRFKVDNKNIQVASLGAETTRDEAKGGYRMIYIS